MEPTLQDGDWLLVRTGVRPRAGELVVVRDPHDPERLLVKRIRELTGAGLLLGGDAAAHAEHLADRGPISAAGLIGRPVFRYAPLRRFGPVR